MKRHRMTGWLAAGMMVGVMIHGASGEEGRMPVAAGYAGLVERCERYERAIRREGWEPVYDCDFQPGSKWSATRPTSTTTLVPAMREKREVLRFGGEASSRSYFLIGPKVSGDYAVELKIMAVSERPNDLSILMNGLGGGPGFQFGGYGNTRNLLWTDGDSDGRQAAFHQVDVSQEVLIERERWYVVRLEVCEGKVRGLVDGRKVGETALSERYDKQVERQPGIYVYNSEALIARILVEKRVTKHDSHGADAEQAWTQAFGAMNRDEVTAGLRELGGLLDDEDWATRQAAQGLLERAGELARPVAEELEKNGTLEQRWRAKQIMRTMGRQGDEMREGTGSAKPRAAAGEKRD